MMPIPAAAPAAPADAKKSSKKLVKRLAKRSLAVVFIVGAIAAGIVFQVYAVSIVIGFWLVCGVLDVGRHRPLSIATIDRYFFGNGLLTWLLAPFNLLMDLIALPFINRGARGRGIYAFDDLPAKHREELGEVLEAARSSGLIERLEGKLEPGRNMIFWKWYGRDLPVTVDVPAFQKRYATVRTIGLSVFTKRRSTSWHFGPLRSTFRVLYNLRPTPDDAAFIQVGDLVHRWNAEPLFIFDDTFMHQSRNETDSVRYCMFIDIVRPTKVPPLMNTIVAGLQVLLIGINRAFYSRWKMIK